MKEKYVLQILNGLDSVNNIRKLDKEILDNMQKERERVIKPLSDSLDEYKYDIQDKLIEDLDKPLNDIIRKLGLAHASDEVKLSVRRGITYVLIELMEQYLVEGVVKIEDEALRIALETLLKEGD